MIETISIGNVKWHHIPVPSDENLQFLVDNFDFHPLDIEDCKSKIQRSKIDIYEDYYFLILHFPYFDKANRFIRTKEIKIFWGKDYIITIGKSHWVIRNLFNEIKEKGSIDIDDDNISQTSDGLLYTMFEKLMLESFMIIRRISSELDDISRGMFTGKPEKQIENISVTRKNLILLNTTFKPQLRVFHKFESGDIKGFTDNMEDYWGNILDYYQKMWDMVEDYEELIEGLSKTFDSSMANRTNETMKILTLVSVVLLPLTFITGLYGMNIELPFAQDARAFIAIIGLMVFVVIFMIMIFKRKHWM